MQGRLGKFCCVEPGPGSARTGKVRFGRIGEAGRVTDRTVEEWQARRCMSRICKERFGVAGMAGSGRLRWGEEWYGRQGGEWYFGVRCSEERSDMSFLGRRGWLGRRKSCYGGARNAVKQERRK